MKSFDSLSNTMCNHADQGSPASASIKNHKCIFKELWKISVRESIWHICTSHATVK